MHWCGDVAPDKRGPAVTLDPPHGAAAADTPPAEPAITERRGRLSRIPLAGALARHVGALVSLVTVAGFVMWAVRQNPPEFPTAPDKLLIIVAAVVVYAVATLLRGWRWHRILHHNGVPHARADAYALCVVGYAGNNLLPARGGELLRIFLMSERSGARKREVLGTVMAERVLDAVSLALLLVLLSVVRVANTSPGDARTLVALGALAVLALVFGMVLLLHRGDRMRRIMRLVVPVARASRRLVSLYGALLLAVTAAIWVLEGVILWLVARARSLAVSPWEGLFVLVLSGFFALIPAAPGYVGTFDAGVLVGLGRLGIHGGTAVTFALLARFILYAPITVVGLALLVARYGGIAMLRSRRWRAETVEEPSPG
jgi:uncharacterized membrane protein YbhN (UPF0104 family)